MNSSTIVLHKSPILQSLTRTGKKKFWQGEAFEVGGECFYKKIWWQEGSKVQESTPVQVFGVNKGKSNETTDSEQAILEVKSVIQKQRDRGYSEDGSNTHIPVKPMLAKKWKEHKNKVTFPCHVQPKLDGFRMLKDADGKVAWTRGGKEHVRDCVQHLMWDTGDVMVDGELVLAYMPTLQETAAAAKKYKPGITDQLLYCIYDVVEPDLPFGKRAEILQRIHDNAPEGVVLVPTYLVKNEDQLMKLHSQFVSEGYEGTIVRSGLGGYEVGHRSNTLLKLKDFEDDEFEIVACNEGKGSFKGKAIFVCVTDDGEEFDVTPNGTHEFLEELWNHRGKYIGRLMTVRYPFKSNSGVPCHARGVNLREDWDMS